MPRKSTKRPKVNYAQISELNNKLFQKRNVVTEHWLLLIASAKMGHAARTLGTAIESLDEIRERLPELEKALKELSDASDELNEALNAE